MLYRPCVFAAKWAFLHHGRSSAASTHQQYLAPRGMVSQPACALADEISSIIRLACPRALTKIPCPSRYAAHLPVAVSRIPCPSRYAARCQGAPRRTSCCASSPPVRRARSPRYLAPRGMPLIRQSPSAGYLAPRGMLVLCQGMRLVFLDVPRLACKPCADSPALRTAGRASRGTSSRETQSHLLNTALAQARRVCWRTRCPASLLLVCATCSSRYLAPRGMPLVCQSPSAGYLAPQGMPRGPGAFPTDKMP